MKELREIFDSQFEILLEKSQLPKYALGKLKYNFVRGAKMNDNHRRYGEDILIREVQKKKQELQKSKIVGQLDHPLDGQSQLKDAMHILADVDYDKNSKLGRAESYILDTTAGRDFLTLLKAGISMGPSMRGWGNVASNGDVSENWKLETIDFVLHPSFGADVAIDQTNLIESANNLFETEAQKKSRLISESHKKEQEKAGLDKQSLMWLIYNRDVDKGLHRGSFEEWKLANEKFIDIAICEVENDVDYETAVKKVCDEEEAKKLLRKEAKKQERVEPKDVMVEAFLAGVSASSLAEKINLEITKQEEIEAGILRSEEIQAILSEAAAAGLNTADEKIREKLLADAQQRKIDTPEEKVLTEEQKAKKKKQEESEKYSYLAGEKILAGK